MLVGPTFVHTIPTNLISIPNVVYFSSTVSITKVINVLIFLPIGFISHNNVVFDENTFPFSTTSSLFPAGQISSQLISLPSLTNFTHTSTLSPQNSDSTPLFNNTNPTTPPFLDSPPIPPPNTTSHSHQLSHVSTSPISTQCPPYPAHNIQLHSNDALILTCLPILSTPCLPILQLIM